MSRRTVKLLAGLPLFSACSDKELKHISNLVVPTSVAAGKVLMVQGQAGRRGLRDRLWNR